jgi:hypothetical protein
MSAPGRSPEKEIAMRTRSLLPFLLAVLAAGCGRTPTETGSLYPTATPPIVADIAGTWSGTMAYLRGSETVTVTITQEADRVHAAWSSASRGAIRFEGAFLSNRPAADLVGMVTIEHPLDCEISPLKVTGSPTTSQISLRGTGICRFDPVRFSLDLSR